MLPGFDVSQFNLVTPIPWHFARFACIRATSGIGLDTRAYEHVGRALDADVRCFAWYAYLKGGPTGAAQAERLLDRAFELEELVGAPCPLAIDIEDPFNGPPWSRDVYGRRLVESVEWLAEHAPRRAVLLYTSPAFWADLAAKAPIVTAVVSLLRLWLADWTPPASVPSAWARWTIWQNAVKTVGGIELDHDLFDGDEADWRALAPGPTRGDLGGVVTAVRGAEGRGQSVEDFVAGDVEGPRFDR